MEQLASNHQNALNRAVEVVRNGGIVVYPTDTAYGLGVDATNKRAIEKLYTLKGRPKNQATHVVVADMVMAGKYVKVTESARKLANAFLPGPLTLVLEALPHVNSRLTAGGETLGIRMPDHPFALSLARESTVPITTPSANVAGGPVPYSIETVLENFDNDSSDIDLLIDGGMLAGGVSTFVDVASIPPKILREGMISREAIEKVLG